MSTGAAPVVAAVRVAGDTHVGKVRTANEDSMIVDPPRGLYVVLDGMGGANAGDVASQLARDTIRDFVTQKRLTMEPKVLLEAAIQAACAAVWSAGQLNREQHGMGTTVVACLVIDPRRAVVGHVGDSRAYLLRAGRLQMLTRDHTIVEDLVVRGLLSPEEGERHPYKNVLSRNLGAKADTKVDILEVELQPGDRLMLCSDGLYGYASAEGIQYLLGSGDAPEHVARDLIDLALRGGGGDNVSTIVIESPANASSTEVVQTSGASVWWQRRNRFVQVAKERGLTQNPICRGLKPDDALDLIALSLCQAIFHDLEKSTGVNVWTFAQNLASGWFERNGDWAALRGLMDILGMTARTVVDEVRTIEPQLGFLLDVAVSRALVVAELALGGLLAERLRQVDGNLIQLHSSMQETIDAVVDDTEPRFIDQATIPFLHPDRPVTSSGVSAEIGSAIEKTLTIARARTAPRAELVKQILTALEAIALDGTGNFSSSVLAARELYGMRSTDEAGIVPLFDAFDQARIITAASVHQITASESVRASVLRGISAAHQRLVGAMTGLVLEAVAPVSENLRKAQTITQGLREQVARAESKRADLEKKFATSIDQSLPWEKRGTTEW
ncbi:MAG: protein serine/threonine phosphatase [Myxococcales bacterium]|nr:protein serine/threonine phosphatase [Myxococcales bacterium]